MWKKYIITASIEDALNYLQQYKASSRIISGATDLMLEMESGVRKDIDVLIDASRIPNTRLITLDEDGIIHLGLNVTHNDCVGSKLIREHALPLALACWQVGSPQIRNRGTITGNLVTASPANDSITPLMALGAEVVLRSFTAERVVPLKDFYTGVRKNVMQNDEMVVEVRFPALQKYTQGMFYKYALRNAQAISLVNVAVILQSADGFVENATITMGAVAPTIIHATVAEEYLKGKELTGEVISQAARLCADSAKPISDIRSSAAYRKKMLEVITRRALQAIRDKRNNSVLPREPVLLRKPGNGKSNGIEETLILDADSPITLTVNGKKVTYKPENHKSLLRLLREDGLLTGTKEGCAEGECGACTVIMDGMAVMSCMVPAQRAYGAEVKTVEGLADNNNLHPIQKAFIQTGAVQCGYCTPGFLVSAAMLMEEKAHPGEDDVKQAVTGNLCRCTGYYSILQAIEKAVSGE
jgi:carbon-monoxide dehydrogenase medium subunit